MDKNYFEVLNSINVNDKIEKKNGLSYLSWPYAWGEIKKKDPLANYKIYENANGWNYHTDGRTCWVKVSVTVNGIEHIEHLPVMDFRNASILADKVTSFDVNKAIQRALTKAAARHGLGLYIYAGEDLPDEASEPSAQLPKEKPKAKASKPAQAKPEALTEEELLFLSQRYTGENLAKLLEYYHIEDISQIAPKAGRELIEKIKAKGAKNG